MKADRHDWFEYAMCIILGSFLAFLVIASIEFQRKRSEMNDSFNQLQESVCEQDGGDFEGDVCYHHAAASHSPEGETSDDG